MTTLQERLLHAEEEGGMTPSDLSTWLGRDYQTVYSWMRAGREPRSPIEMRELNRRLDMLEKIIWKMKAGEIIVPREHPAKGRQDFIQRLYDDAKSRGVPFACHRRRGLLLRLRSGRKA